MGGGERNYDKENLAEWQEKGSRTYRKVFKNIDLNVDELRQTKEQREKPWNEAGKRKEAANKMIGGDCVPDPDLDPPGSEIIWSQEFQYGIGYSRFLLKTMKYIYKNILKKWANSSWLHK